MSKSDLSRETLFAVQATDLFSGLSEADLADLLAGASVQALDAGAVLMQPGAATEHFYVLLLGLVELFHAEEGRSAVVEVVRGPAVLGEAALFDATHPAGARAVTPVRVVAIPARPFLARVEPRFDLILKMLGSLSYRLRVLVRQIAELKLKTTAQRLGGFLLSLTEAQQGEVKVRLPYDKKLVAATLGMTPESLSRALGRLGPLGVKSTPENAISIQEVEALRRFCAEESE